ncbi:MAG: sigma-E processing peptidase SpoIIGA [Lachnospiraceae bacterium]|nr:sigma-E processing peptidase SpoIIGA [Lachnospiraceae bacterium]
MYYELYIDVLFLENLLVDYLLLSLLKRILKCPAKRIRMLLAAALGSVGICLVYIFSLQGTFVGTLFIYVVLGTVMVRAGLHIKDWHLLGKAIVLLYICSLLLGGIFQWVQRNLEFPVYPFVGFSLTSYWILSACVGWMERFRKRSHNVCETTISFRGRNIHTKALYDTGNQLYDPIFGKPVSIITEELHQLLCKEEEVLYQQVPFHTIGKQGSIMEAFFGDYLCIHTAEGEVRLIEHPLLGITKEPLSSKNEYGMILHSDLLN